MKIKFQSETIARKEQLASMSNQRSKRSCDWNNGSTPIFPAGRFRQEENCGRSLQLIAATGRNQTVHRIGVNWLLLIQTDRSISQTCFGKRTMNVDDYQSKITASLIDEIRAALPPMLDDMAEQSVFAFGLVSYDGPWFHGVSACSREGLGQNRRKLESTSALTNLAPETACAEWNYMANAVSESLDLSLELSSKFYDGLVDGLDESVDWVEAQERFNRVFLEAGVDALSKLRKDGEFPAPPFEEDVFLALHNPDPDRYAVQRMIDSSKILNSPEWHAKFVAELPDPSGIGHE